MARKTEYLLYLSRERSVVMCVSVVLHIMKSTSKIHRLVHACCLQCGCGSVFLRRYCSMLRVPVLCMTSFLHYKPWRRVAIATASLLRCPRADAPAAWYWSQMMTGAKTRRVPGARGVDAGVIPNRWYKRPLTHAHLFHPSLRLSVGLGGPMAPKHVKTALHT